MKQFKLLGLMLVAVFAVSSVVASVASAVELTVLPLPGNTAATEVKFKFESKAGEETRLETLAGKRIECTKVTGNGQFTSETLGPVEFKFVGCREPALGVKCTGLETGDREGEILFKASFHIRHLLVNNSPSEVSLVVLPGHVHFTCFGVLFLVLGCVSSMDVLTVERGEGVIERLRESVFANFLQERGDQGITSIDNQASNAMENCLLETKEGTGGRYESSGQLGSGTIKEFEQNGRKVTLLVHLR
jgi:hypothetical protein